MTVVMNQSELRKSVERILAYADDAIFESVSLISATDLDLFLKGTQQGKEWYEALLRTIFASYGVPITYIGATYEAFIEPLPRAAEDAKGMGLALGLRRLTEIRTAYIKRLVHECR